MYSSEKQKSGLFKNKHLYQFGQLGNTSYTYTVFQKSLVYMIQPFLTGLSSSTLQVKEVSTGNCPSNKLLHQTAFLRGDILTVEIKNHNHRCFKYIDYICFYSFCYLLYKKMELRFICMRRERSQDPVRFAFFKSIATLDQHYHLGNQPLYHMTVIPPSHAVIL